MKKQRVYIDTSVIGGCLDEAFAPWSNGLMEDFRAGNLSPVLSEIVAAEIDPAPEAVRECYSRLLRLDPEILALSDEVRALAVAYQAQQIVPSKFSNDLLHIALATIGDVDILVSWNFKHIVHFDKIRRFNAVNRTQGYKEIAIYSPREVTSYGEDGN